MSFKKLLLALCLVAAPLPALAQSLGPISDTLSGKYNFMYTGSHMLFYNGTYFQRWTGETWDSSMTAAPTNPSVNSFNVFYNGTVSQYLVGSLLSTEYVDDAGYAPHGKTMLHGYDVAAPAGQEWKYINMLSTQADGQAASINTFMTSSFLYGYNGSTFDMLRVGASNELQVTDVATRPGEDVGNDWRKIRVESISTDAPAFTDTAIVGGAGLTIALAGLEVIGWEKVCLYFYNSGANAFTDVSIETSADNTNYTGDLGFTSCDSAAVGVTCVYCFEDAYRYVRARVSSAVNTSVRAWFTMKK